MSSRKGRWLIASHGAAAIVGAVMAAALIGSPAGRAERAPDGDVTASRAQPSTAKPESVASLPQPLTADQQEALEQSLFNGDGLDFAVPLPPREARRTVTAGRGDTFMKLILSTGAPRAEAYDAITAMRKVFDPRSLNVGQTITTLFLVDEQNDPDDPTGTFTGFLFKPAVDYTISVTRRDNGFAAEKIRYDLERTDARVAGLIRSNLYSAAVDAGMPPTVLVELIRLLSWDVDFQRDVQPGDAFDALVDRYYHKDGRSAHWGDIHYAEVILRGTPFRFYRYESKRHGVEYFDENGRSAQKALMKTPIDGARLSSRFGRRRHPILGYNKMHRGVDFAAPAGTPIYAAGSGTIAYAGRHGAYGRYIRIRHNSRYATAYAHLRRFARGIRHGRRVRQGQVIGYVGTSGRSTGPHLHYEVHIDGHQVNPLRLKLPSGRSLSGGELEAFRKLRIDLDQRVAALPRGNLTASR